MRVGSQLKRLCNYLLMPLCPILFRLSVSSAPPIITISMTYPICLFLLTLAALASAGEPDDLEGLVYFGIFKNQSPVKLFNYVDVQTGNIDAYFLSDLRSRQEGNISMIVFELFNPKYHDKKAAAVVVNVSNYDQINHQWMGNNTNMDVYTFYHEDAKSKQVCNGSYLISLDNRGSSFNPKLQRISVSFNSTGEGSCNFVFTGIVSYADSRYTILGYCGFVSLIILIQIASTYKLLRQITSNVVQADKMSLLTVCMITIQDFYLTMMHLYFLMTENQYYEYFILPIFLLILLSVVFDMKVLFVIWRCKYIQEINNGQLRRKITVFYIQFYLGMFGYLILMYFFTYNMWPLYLQSAIFLPQIIHNVRKGNNPQFYPAYILGMLGMRVVLPLYYRGCPENIYQIEPNVAFCFIWVSLFAVQIVVLLIQKLCGPRFFIPKKLIPGHFDYRCKIEISPGAQPIECNICLQSVSGDEENNLSINGSIMSSLMKVKKVTVMKTPCGHIFHPECLSIWADVKLECPSCRLKLPPIE